MCESVCKSICVSVCIVCVCVREQQQQTLYLDIFKYALAASFPRHPPRLPYLLVAEFKVAPSHAMSIHTPYHAHCHSPHTHTTPTAFATRVKAE